MSNHLSSDQIPLIEDSKPLRHQHVSNYQSTFHLEPALQRVTSTGGAVLQVSTTNKPEFESFDLTNNTDGNTFGLQGYYYDKKLTH